MTGSSIPSGRSPRFSGAQSIDDSDCPIGVFDSGVGGLTVLKAIAQRLPQESLLYFGDTARLPYGTRSQAEIIQFVREILDWMTHHRTKMVVMACNTSSALALDYVRAEYKIPILGVILPAARVAVTTGQRVGVIATQATASSRAYTQAMQEIVPATQVWEVGCPEFVPLIEQNRIHDPETRAVVTRYVEQLLSYQIDTLIYGCTHYPHLKPIVDTILPSTVRQVDPASHAAEAVAKELQLMSLGSTTVQRTVRFGVSDRPDRFAALAQQWLGYAPEVEEIDLCSSESATSALFPSPGLPVEHFPVG
ncbi:MAG: glutamate racemase [Elainellaceae cyanobacterium]